MIMMLERVRKHPQKFVNVGGDQGFHTQRLKENKFSFFTVSTQTDAENFSKLIRDFLSLD